MANPIISKTQITPTDFSNQFVLTPGNAGGISHNIDGTTIKADPITGILSVTGSQSVTPTVVVGNTIATILNNANGTTINLKETITKIVDALNTITYTDEAGVDTVATKITSVDNTVDAVAKTIVTTVNGVSSAVTDISGFYADINVDTLSWNQTTYVLTLTETDGTVQTLNLSSLVAIATNNTNSVIFTGDGTTTTPLKADVKLDPIVGNLLKVTTAGTKVDVVDVLALHSADIEIRDLAGNLIGYMHATQSM